MRVNKRSSPKSEEGSIQQNVMVIIKGILLAVLFSIVCILIFALVFKLANLDESVIPVVNQIIKIVSILLGAGLVAKNAKEKGWLKGGITGLAYIIIGFLIFSLVDGKFNFNTILVSDSLLGIIVGAIGGMIGVNLKYAKP